jgi:hypothetical protein
MRLSSAELAEAKDAAGSLLEAMELTAYLYQVEPRDGEWKVRIDCATTEGWQSLTLSLDKQTLIASRTDATVRDRLIGDLRARLGDCRRA